MLMSLMQISKTVLIKPRCDISCHENISFSLCSFWSNVKQSRPSCRHLTSLILIADEPPYN